MNPLFTLDPTFAPLTIALVGHTGRMGRMLMETWSAAGCEVIGIDCRPGCGVRQKDISRARVVLLAVPVGALCEVMGRLAPCLRPEQLLMDITSVKSLPMLIMQEFHTGPVIGGHPLFGPQPGPQDLHTILVAGRHATQEHKELAEQLFYTLGSSVAWATSREHDRGVAFAQSLNFAMSASFFSTIARHRECMPFLTPSFKRHMEAARKHLTQDRAMFCEFTARNPCFEEAVEDYRSILKEALLDLERLSDEAAAWFDGTLEPDREQASRPEQVLRAPCRITPSP